MPPNWGIKEYSSILHCCICDQFFIDDETYNEHNTSKHEGKGRSLPSAPFTCLDCHKDFYDEILFQSHLARHGAARRGAEYAAQHGTQAASKKKLFFCPHCNRDFATLASRNDHIRICPRLYQCLDSTCLKRFRNLAGLVSHLESGTCNGGYTRDGINRFICERDKKSLITLPGALYMLEEYQKDAVGSESTGSDIEDTMAALSIGTSSWGILTPDSDGSEIEFQDVSHNDIDCIEGAVEALSTVSSHSNLTPRSLESSILIPGPTTAHGKSKPINQCGICGKIFRTGASLLQRINSPTHPAESRVLLSNQTCGICSKVFATEVALRQHLDLPLICQIYTTANYLSSSEIRTH
ncbi:hypothetical protein TWF281_002723 [Arthrobotrys megalospora]